MDLSSVMNPKSIVLVGASTRDHTIGHDLLHRLIDYGFQGDLYLVNPKGGVLEGREVYTSVSALPDGIDLAIIAINAKYMLDTIDQCHERGIKGIVVISAGFKETGAEGLALEKALTERVHQYGMTMVGPNCLGVVNTNPAVRMDGCFAETLPRRGDIGFVSQSGALGGGILNILKDLGIGFAQFISIGNQADVNAASAIEFWENEEDVHQILLYMESILDPKAFRKLATRVSKKKPILALKAGRSAAGASAASSHTGSLAGADKAADAAEAAGADKAKCVGEGDIVRDFDPAAGEGLKRERVTCEAPQHLSAEAVPYLVLRRRDGEGEDAPLVPRLTSASQIEAYSTCPLCWFVSYRVKPQSIDAGFGNMEKGNFVHDVLEHLHARLPQEGMERVTPMNLPRAQELLREVFDETLAEHAGKRGTEGPLVPLSPVEERQVAEILPQLEGVLTYEAEALTPFVPRYLEFAFNELRVEYAGWPLGGRIDRVDVDAESRAVVIDYKHRSGVEEFKLADPTVRDEESGDSVIENSGGK